MRRLVYGTLAAMTVAIASTASFAAPMPHPPRGVESGYHRADYYYWNHHRYHHRAWDRYHHRWHYW